MAVTVCVPVRDLAALLQLARVRVPGLPEGLRALRESIESWESPTKVLQRFLAAMDAALLPLRAIAQLLEFVAAVLNCFNATLEAVRELSPDPIVTCFNNLRDVVNRLASYFPPFVYMQMLADIVLLLIMYLDELLLALLAIDARITELNAIRARAADLNDANLLLVADCVQREIDNARANTMGGLEALARIVGAVTAIIDALPLIDIDTSGWGAAFDAGAGGVTTTVQPIATTIRGLREVLAIIYRGLATPLGEYIVPDPPPAVPLVN